MTGTNNIYFLISSNESARSKVEMDGSGLILRFAKLVSCRCHCNPTEGVTGTSAPSDSYIGEGVCAPVLTSVVELDRSTETRRQ